MSKDPAFLFYTADFLLGTLTMSFEDKGKYITLLSYMHQTDRLSEDIAKILVGDISANLKSKFKIDDNNLWYNERLEEEITKRKCYMETRRNNGKYGGRPKGSKEPGGRGKERKNEKYPFERFWKIYDKPTEKESCELKWEELAKEHKKIIFQRLPEYIKATPERQFRKNPLTYLIRKVWLDEHIPEPYITRKKSAFELLVETGKYE